MVEDHEDEYADVLSLMECHYTRSRAWLKSDSQLLDDVHRVRHIPTVLVFGRYDLVTRMAASYNRRDRMFDKKS